MEWTLCEAALKAVVGFAVGLILKRTWRAVMEVKRCMIPGCRGLASTPAHRGLCSQCHKRAKELVDSGETTWEQLAERELCEKRTNPFDDAYSKAMEEK